MAYFDSPARVAALGGFLYLLLTLWNLHPHYDLSRFIVAGDYFTEAEKTPGEIHVYSDSYGYDGQLFYRLALDPFTSVRTEHGVTLDDPAFRQQRIGYPLVVWTLSLGGQPELVPRMMVLVNFAGLVALAWLGALIALHFGRPAWLGLAFALYPGLAFSYVRDLAEILTAVWLLAGVLSVLRGRHVAAALLMSLAVATRETALLVPGAIGMVLLVRYFRGGDLRSHPWPVYLLPLATYAGIALWMWLSWGQPSISGGMGNLGLPLVGMFHFLAANVPPVSAAQFMNMAGFGVCLATLVIGVLAMRTSRVNFEWKLAWLFYAVLMLCLTAVIWLSYGEFMRAFTELWLLTVLLALASSLPWQRLAAGVLFAGWALFSLVQGLID